MTEEEKKIAQLELELEKLSEQLKAISEQVRHLRKNSSESSTVIKQEENKRSHPLKEGPLKKSSPVYLEHFIGLKLLHLAGIVVLVIGISIGVKYAVDKELISPVTRIILAYSAGVLLYILSARLKNRIQLFSAVLFSGAMASLYFTTYAAFVYYDLFPLGLAFGVMVIITIFTAYTAIKYDRQEIAILGMTGSYGIPFLISANSERIDLFFAYITLINLGVVFLSYRKTWKAMVRFAMLASWLLFIGWALSRYKPELQGEAILFLFIFYVMFALSSIGFSIVKKETLGLLEIQLFLVNSLLAYFAALLIFTDGHLDARSVHVTGIACAVFFLQAFGTKVFFPKEKLVFSYLLGFALLSLIFYIGLKWDGIFVTVLWLLVAVGLFAAGALSKTGWMRLTSMLLTGVTLVKLILVDRNNFTTGQKIISYVAIGVILLLLSFFYQKTKPEKIGIPEEQKAKS